MSYQELDDWVTVKKPITRVRPGQVIIEREAKYAETIAPLPVYVPKVTPPPPEPTPKVTPPPPVAVKPTIPAPALASSVTDWITVKPPVKQVTPELVISEREARYVQTIAPLPVYVSKVTPPPPPPPPPKPIEGMTVKEFEEKYGVRPDIPETVIITKVTQKKGAYEIEYYEPPEPTIWEKLYARQPTLALGAFSLPGMGFVPPREYPITKRIARIKTAYPGPLGSVLTFGIGGSEWITGPGLTKAVIATGIEAVTGKGLTTKHFEELGKYPLEYHLGSLGMDIFFGYAMAKPVSIATGKVVKVVKTITPKFIKDPVAHAVKFGRVPKAFHRLGMKVKYTEPIYTITHIPSQAKTFLAKHFPSAKMAVERGLAWGEKQFLQPGAFEVWATTVEPHKFVGYPIIYGKATQYAVIQVTKPTAFQQIQWQIEKGMFPRMGGLSAQQRLITRTAKHTYAPWRMPVTIAKPLGKQIPTVLLGLGVTTVAKTLPAKTPMPPPLLVPKLERIPYEPEKEKFKPLIPDLKLREKEPVIPIPKLPFELEKEKFRELMVVTPKRKQREVLIPIPKLSFIPIQPQLPKIVTKTVQRQTQILIPKIPTPTLQIPTPKPPVPFRLPRGGWDVSRLGRDLFGKWFKREHPIATRKEVARLFGLPTRRKRKATRKPRKKKRKKTRRKRR